MQPKSLSEDEIQNTVTSAVREAVDFVETEVAPDRIKAQKYFDGKSVVDFEEGRSRVVATKVRDTIRAIKPALMRVFLQSDKPVEFIPNTPQAVMGADQATKYAKYIFERNNGFRILSDVFHDALIKKVGVAKVYYDEVQHVEIDEYTDLTPEQLAFIENDPESEVLSQEETIIAEAVIDDMGMEIQPRMASYNLRVARTSTKGQIKIQSVAPEDFFVDRMAVSIDDCYVCGHTSEARVGDLVAMGFDFETVYNLGGAADGTVDDEEELARRGWDDTDDDENAADPSMRKVQFTEAYMKMDIEGTGVPRLYKFICAGNDYEILDYELCDYIPFAIFEVDPEPHTFFGRSLAEIVTEDQDAATSLLRGLLDGLAMANNPRVMAVQNLVNMDDLLNNEIGGVVRVKDINALREFSIGNGATAALPALQFYDEAIRAKTGVTGAAMGMDADALQSQTAAGVNAAVQAASAVSELIARNLAEGGMRQMFRLIAQIARANPNPNEMMRLDGQFVPVDPRSWTNDLDLVTNVGLGNNRREDRIAALQMTMQTQMQIWQAYGPTNGIVSMTGIRNTLADILGMAGIHNADRYYNPMNPQIEQQLMAMAAQAAQGQQQQQQPSDPNAAFLQAEQMKMSARVQADMAKTQLDAEKMRMDDDLERDRMAQDLAIKAAELLAKTGVQLDLNAIKREQQMPRMPFVPNQTAGF
ncbi:hypothetical protein UFOVP373_33 [uncultured Caudovirales phage]|uniref:Portal protein n=1 Tax=uncultured Caudovirales phage TaxID=2100421 RepID=A0A6J7X151_9CAUD|nr:hypothetical protein UFOVP373_33 [uncultured Caudovirales phage]